MNILKFWVFFSMGWLDFKKFKVFQSISYSFNTIYIQFTNNIKLFTVPFNQISINFIVFWADLRHLRTRQKVERVLIFRFVSNYLLCFQYTFKCSIAGRWKLWKYMIRIERCCNLHVLSGIPLLHCTCTRRAVRAGPRIEGVRSCPQTRPSPPGPWLRSRNSGGPGQGIGGRGHDSQKGMRASPQLCPAQGAHHALPA